jgi:hypothetical protein
VRRLAAVTLLALAGACSPGAGETSSTRVDVFEDGSGVQLVDGAVTHRFEDGTFTWDCMIHGNGVCGR